MEQFEYEKKKKKMKRGPLLIIIAVICLVIGSVGGYSFALLKRQPMHINQSIYDTVSLLIEDNFLDIAKSKYSLEERMLSGMVAALGDPHSAYMSSESAMDMNMTINGKFEGIGVLFTTSPYGGVVLDVFASSPALKAGMQKGDVITHVAGTSVLGKDNDQIKKMIQGERGTSVRISILRNGVKKDLDVMRNSVDSSVNTRIDGQLGYLQITTFGQSTTDQVKKALEMFKSQNIDIICIDLRGNGGGYLDSVRGLLELFLPAKTPMFTIQDKKGKKQEYVSKDGEKFHFNKGYILVDEGTASSSEVMSSALKEQLSYHIIGETTFGKGTVQTQATLQNSATLKYTYAKWLTSKGEWIHEKGIKPDVEIKHEDIHDYGLRPLEKDLQFDMVSGEVIDLQRILKCLGYKVDREDGYFSLATKQGLMAFEKDYHLKSDGVLNKDDATVLLSAMSYYLYQQQSDQAYQKVLELMK